MPQFGSLTSALAPTSDAPVPTKADILRSMGQSPPPPRKANKFHVSPYKTSAAQASHDRSRALRDESRLPIYGPPKLSFFKRLACCSLKGDSYDSSGLKEEKGKEKLDKMSDDDRAPQKVDLSAEKERMRERELEQTHNSAPVYRSSSQSPPPTGTKAGPSSSTPPRIVTEGKKKNGSGASTPVTPSSTTNKTTAANANSAKPPLTAAAAADIDCNDYDDRDCDTHSISSISISIGSMGGGGGGMDHDFGCILGSCDVKMADGSTKPVSTLAKGELIAISPVDDSVNVPGAARIRCILAFRVPNGMQDMVRVPDSGLVISPTHPIVLPQTNNDEEPSDSESKSDPESQWIDPNSHYAPESISCAYVYNILLAPLPSPANPRTTSISITIGNVSVSPLGNPTSADGPSSFSSHYGRVVTELRRIDPDGFQRGFVRLAGMRRGPDGRVRGFRGVSRAGTVVGGKDRRREVGVAA